MLSYYVNYIKLWISYVQDTLHSSITIAFFTEYMIKIWRLYINKTFDLSKPIVNILKHQWNYRRQWEFTLNENIWNMYYNIFIIISVHSLDSNDKLFISLQTFRKMGRFENKSFIGLP